MKKTITHPRLGEIELSRTRRARRITLSVRPGGRVRLSIPVYCTIKSGLAFLESREQWVAENVERLSRKFPDKIIEPPYSTRSHTLVFVPTDTDKISSRISTGKITVTHPQSTPHSAPEVQEEARAAIIRALRAEAKEYLPEMVEKIARRHGFSYNSVTVRATVSRWGSCSGRDDISLSIYLMRLPDHLIEYVILHELCHTRHKDHSPAYHALADRLLEGREKALIKEMRSYRPGVI